MIFIHIVNIVASAFLHRKNLLTCTGFNDTIITQSRVVILPYSQVLILYLICKIIMAQTMGFIK